MESDGTNPWRTSGYWEMYAESKGVYVLAGNKWWHLGGSGKVWKLPIFFQSCKTSWKCQWSSTTCMAHPWNWFVLLEQNGLYCCRELLQQVPDSEENSEQFHTFGDKGTGHDLHRVWMHICTEKWQWSMLYFQGVPWLPRILQDPPYHKQPILSTKQWIYWSFGGYFEEIDGKVHQGWKTIELWPTQGQSDTHSRKPSTTPIGSDRMQAKNLSSSDSIKHWEVCGKFQNTQGTVEKTTKYFQTLFYGTWARTACFAKEVHGNVWKTCVIDQPAKEPESYWIKFPDNSILRTRSMIKSWAQPSYFKLEAESKEWSSTGLIPPHSHHPFNSNLPAPEIPTLPVGNPVPPALTSKATPPVQENIPVSSTGVSQPSTGSDPAVIPSTLRWSTHSIKGIPPVRFTPSNKWAMCTWNIMEVSGKAVFM